MYENYNTGQPYIPAKLNKQYHLCRSCHIEQNIQKCLDEIAVLTQKVRDLENLQMNHSITLADLSNHYSETPNNPQASSSEHNTSQLRQTADEVFEIAKRKRNVIINGLPERNSDSEDFIHFANICHSYLFRNISNIPKGLDEITKLHVFFVYSSNLSKPVEMYSICGRTARTMVGLALTFM